MPRKLTDTIYVRVGTNQDGSKYYGRWYNREDEIKRFVTTTEVIKKMSWKALLRYHSKKALENVLANKNAFSIDEAIAYLQKAKEKK